VLLDALAVLACAGWIFLLADRGGFWRMRDSRPAASVPRAAPGVVAIIPARNEAAVVAQAVASLAKQRYRGPFHIVLVDDASTDGTAACARAAVPSDLLDVVPSAPLPAGWTGKLWAVLQGIEYATLLAPDYLLLTDADIVHPSDNLDALVARAEAESCDLVSYMATLHCRSLAERALIPAFVFFFFMLYPPAWIRDPRRRTAGAAGGCSLIRRKALEKAGGIEAIRGELIDDCALARAVKRGGGRVWLGLSAGTRSIRPYHAFSEIESMIARTAFTQLRYSAALLACTTVGLGLIFLVPPLLTVTATAHPLGAGFAATAWLMMSVAYLPALRFYRLSPLWAPVLPLAAAFYLVATVHSAIAFWCGRGGVWKGRVTTPASESAPK
jgi:hopene-associated glycosyltransferase HpnB